MWPLSVVTSAPLSTLKIFAVLSAEPVARYLPHGEKHTEFTPLELLYSTACGDHVAPESALRLMTRSVAA